MSNIKGKKYKLYHGLRNGDDETTLEKFIITGALSTLGMSMSGGYGFHLTSCFSEAAGFSSFSTQPKVLEFETAIDGKNWRIDSNRQWGSEMLLKNLKDLIPLLEKSGPYEQQGMYVQSLQETEEGINIAYIEKKDSGLKNEIIRWDGKGNSLRLMEIVFNLMQEIAPGIYEAENLKALTAVLESGDKNGDGACLRYTGKDPLVLDRILLSPATGYNAPPEAWEIIYDRRNPAASFKKVPPPPAPPHP